MKKIISLALVTVMCLSLCLMLGSCELVEQYLPMLESDKKGPVTTVTEEEWNKALDAVNYEASTDYIISQILTADKPELSREMVVHVTATAELTETAQHNRTYSLTTMSSSEEIKETTHTYEKCFTQNSDNGKWYILTKNNDASEWAVEEANELIPTTIGDTIEELCTADFSDFTYDEEKKAYVSENINETWVSGINEEENAEGKIYIYFEDKNIVKIEVIVKGEQDGEYEYEGEMVAHTTSVEYTFLITFTNHGKATVIVPQYTVPEE